MTATFPLSPLSTAGTERQRAARVQARRQIYRRRRLVVAVVAFVVIAMVAIAVVTTSGGVGADDGTARPAAPSITHVVGPGDTLWSIARAVAPGADPRPIVHELQKQTGSPVLQVGQVVTVPARVLP